MTRWHERKKGTMREGTDRIGQRRKDVEKGERRGRAHRGGGRGGEGENEKEEEKRGKGENVDNGEHQEGHIANDNQ